MKFVCAWCGIDMRTEEEPNSSNTVTQMISHDICLNCISKMEIFDEINLSGINSSDFYLPFGETIINANNEILKFRSNLKNANIIGKNFFKDLIPKLTTSDIKNKLGGLRRRKSDGQREFYFLLRFKNELNLIYIELYHYVTKKETVILLSNIN